VEQVVVVALPDFPGGKVSLQLQTAGGVKASASVEVKRCKIKLPDEFDYPIWAWDYLDWPRPYVEAAELGAFLQPYHFNLATLTCSPIRDTAKFDEQGNVTTPPDFSTWEKALDAQKYCKWFYCGYPPELSNPNWEAKYSNILTLIKGFFEKRGIQPEQIYFAAADEDHDPAKWSAAKKVRDRVAPGIKLFSTGYIPGPDNVYFNSIDIFVNTGGSGVRLADLPVFNGFEEKYPKVTFIQYDCGSTFDSDPGRYRLYPWRNMRLGWRGVGLWTRDDSLWKATMGYQLFYDKANAPAELKVKENLFPSRRLEAFRAGLEDRWILEEAQRLAGRRLEKNPNDPFAQGILDFVDRSLARAFERETDPYVAEDAIQWLVPRLDALTG
jgi:hypothetical protein